MKSLQVKVTVSTLFFLCFAASGLFVSGCSKHYNREDTMIQSQKVMVIGLNNDTEYQPLLTGRPQTCGMRSGRVYLKPGETCGRHSTEAHEEMLVFLSGKGEALIGEKETPFEVGQGRISYVPQNTMHNVKNTGTEPLVYIYCVAPVNLDTKKCPAQREHSH